MRNTTSPELEELVFWYYAGRGLSKEAAQNLSYSSTPNLIGRVSSDYHAAANEFVTEGRKVKGGELCLHKVGFCDLYGLLKPWIAAVKTPSINAEGSKKEKHLAIILDSCYSGIIAQELEDFAKNMNKKDPTFLAENSVTIQAACCPDQPTCGYFTPIFVKVHDPENAELRKNLKKDWNENLTEEMRNEYKLLELPSPMVVTTKCQDSDDHVTMELTVQNFKLTLFTDPGFFKFCYIKVNQLQGESLFIGEGRALNPSSANNFMKSRPFTVLDYKLKTLATAGQYAGTPMGLFLLKDPTDSCYAVCAHIHFQQGNTNNPQRINLVHHKKPRHGITPFIIPGTRTYKEQGEKFEVSHLGRDAEDLVKACSAFVENKNPGTWKNVSLWNMTGLGFSGLFRVQDLQNQRSEWEGNYLKDIAQFDLPKAASE